ncbi:FAD-binding oxidoreductase [Modestobacter roseus]|uniref:FAD/FMN-containing dehydrogenase n=1 Tax=Modestobacter roseus TaxID=1181884 RepID=A0A562IWF3_9ACTN|nr:FAD-binding oxidoreductase [Modestobacter roseus]MQA34894.1 FAD-binding protein [Modestobacter roseus]TWH75222.1 FAD/FMN-containing dehydrogenase [Modestobacter roseus]
MSIAEHPQSDSAAVRLTVPPDAAALDALRARVHGPVYRSGDEGAAAEAACWNVAVTHRPAVVVGATCAADVAAAVAWAVEHDLPVAAHATGHGPVHAAVGGLLISTRRMQGVAVDPVRRVARVQAGSKWAAVLAATEEHRLVPLVGSSSDVGVVGYTLGGGVGPFARRYGFAADSVVAVDLVTADGELRRLTADEEPELFWAVRGSRSNLGVVTALEIQLFPADEIHAGCVFFAGADAATVLHTYRQWAPALPEEVTTSASVLRLPPLETLPEPLRGQLVVQVTFAATGLAPERCAELLAPMQAAGRILLGHVGRMLPTELDAVHMDPVDPMPTWERGVLLRELTAGTVDALLAAAGPGVDVPLVSVQLRQLGGALARQPRVPSAVAGRDGAWGLMVIAPGVPELADVVPVVVRGVLGAAEPWRAPGGLLNFLGAVDGPDDVVAAFPAEVAQRLVAVKRRVDPRGVFTAGHALTARS